MQKVLAILKAAQTGVATVTQESAFPACMVVMVDYHLDVYLHNTHLAANWAAPQGAIGRPLSLSLSLLSSGHVAPINPQPTLLTAGTAGLVALGICLIDLELRLRLQYEADVADHMGVTLASSLHIHGGRLGAGYKELLFQSRQVHAHF